MEEHLLATMEQNHVPAVVQLVTQEDGARFRSALTVLWMLHVGMVVYLHQSILLKELGNANVLVYKEHLDIGVKISFSDD